MNILEDTRQKPGKHDAKDAFFQEAGDRVIRCKLPWGDYALAPRISVDTKQTIYELAQDIDQDHKRFRNELKEAQDSGCKLYILVENEDGVTDLQSLMLWAESYQHYQMRVMKNARAQRIFGVRLAKACKTMSERYGTEFLFCRPEEAGQKVRELLNGG